MRASFVLGAALVALVAAAALLSFVWTPYDVAALDIAAKLQAPSAAHWLGTDHFGRDVLSMIMVGARVSIAVALVAVGIGLGVGVPRGLLAAARRGSLLDEAIMRANDLVFAFPALLIAVMITTVLGPSAINAIIAIGIFNVPVFARVTRGQALVRHAFRNALIPVLTIIGLQFSFLLAGAIIIENVFFLPGVGRLIFQAINQRDLVVVQSVVMILVFAVILVTFLVDVTYALVDPRLRRATR